MSRHQGLSDRMTSENQGTLICKPYAIIDQKMFDAEIGNLRKIKTAELIC